MASFETISGGGGALFVRSWLPSSAPRVILAICHGFNSHSGYHEWVGEQSALGANSAFDSRISL